jgi:hypothetical protein
MSIAFGVLVGIAVLCGTAAAQEPRNVGNATTAQSAAESEVVGAMTETTSWVYRRDHQWNEYAQNNCGRRMFCNAVVYLTGAGPFLLAATFATE